MFNPLRSVKSDAALSSLAMLCLVISAPPYVRLSDESVVDGTEQTTLAQQISRGGLHGSPGCLALARWAGWYGVQVGRHVKYVEGGSETEEGVQGP